MTAGGQMGEGGGTRAPRISATPSIPSGARRCLTCEVMSACVGADTVFLDKDRAKGRSGHDFSYAARVCSGCVWVCNLSVVSVHVSV